MKVTSLLASLAVGTAVTVAMAVATPAEETNISISPMMAVTGFSLYQPPDRLEISWYDYTESATGGPSPGNTPTAYPTSLQSYPYRAVFYGGYPDNTATLQNYYSEMYVVYSKVPVSELFTFEYMSERGNMGYIRATVNNRDKLGWEDDDQCIVMRNGWSGISSGQVNVSMFAFSTHTVYTSTYYFDFDFYYQCCGQLEISGLRNVTAAPYGYILTCTETDGSGGGSTSGSSSSSSSSGSSSSSSVASGIPGGAGSFPDYESSWSDWEQSGGGNSNSGSYPWENESNIPEKDWNFTSSQQPQGSEGDTGENGDTWELPEYTPIEPPIDIDDLNIPDMPEMNWPETPTPSFDFPGLEYYPDSAGGWPPPFPGTSTIE